jgi:CDP-paratose 2-epimerase
VDDLINAFLMAIHNIEVSCGKSYNIGGGPKNTISLLEFIKLLEKILGKKISYKFEDWRPGDQKVFVSDIRKAGRDFKWRPTVKVAQGVNKLIKWVSDNEDMF